jgi:ABC-type antimicrobial peptide transport system permease subunit
MARKYFAEANPIGREFRVHGAADEFGTPTRIIGVVQDAKYETLREATLPTAYLFMNSNAEPASRLTYELLATGPLSTVVQNVKDVISGVDTRISFEFSTLEEQVASSLARERMLALLSTYFGGLALVLAMIGLYGTLSYSVARRRKEIGVRLSVGAAPARILRMVLAEATTIVVIGLVGGVIAAIALVRLISSFLFGLSPTDPATIAFAAGLLTLVALAASALPAWRAANTDALIPLRED